MGKLYKSFESKAVDIDEKSNVVVVYYAAFGNKDTYHDVIQPGAFTKTISEWGPNGKDLIYHLKDHWEEVSKPKELSQDSYGLRAVVGFPNTTKGRDTIEEYKYGMWKYHSIGYETMKEQKYDDYNDLLELKLYEGSHVKWPANDRAITQLVDLKGADISSLTKMMEDFIRNSNATDEAIKRMEEQYTELKSLLTEPPKDTQPNMQDYGSVLANFNLTN